MTFITTKPPQALDLGIGNLNESFVNQFRGVSLPKPPGAIIQVSRFVLGVLSNNAISDLPITIFRFMSLSSRIIAYMVTKSKPISLTSFNVEFKYLNTLSY